MSLCQIILDQHKRFKKGLNFEFSEITYICIMNNEKQTVYVIGSEHASASLEIALTRFRFEHPEFHVVVLNETEAKEMGKYYKSTPVPILNKEELGLEIKLIIRSFEKFEEPKYFPPNEDMRDRRQQNKYRSQLHSFRSYKRR